MATSTANRYRDLLSLLPYKSNGEVLPYKTRPHEFEYQTSKRSRTFDVLVNNERYSQVTTNSEGLAIIRSPSRLPPGEYEFRIVDPLDETGTSFFVTIKNVATWLKAYATVTEELDRKLENIRDAFSIGTVGGEYIEARYGRPLRQPFPTNFLLEEYRNLLIQLRPAYRHFGGQPFGLQQAVSGFTSSSPFEVPTRWRPRWVLGSDAALNQETNLLVRTRTSVAQYAPAGSSTELSDLNRQSRVFVHPGVTTSLTTSNIRAIPSPQKLSVTFSASGARCTLIGTDEIGDVIVEVVPDPSVTPLAATYETQLLYGSLTSGQVTTGTGTASIGLSDTRFVTLTRIGDLNRAGATVALSSDGRVATTGYGPDHTYGAFDLSWGGGELVRVSDLTPTTLRDIGRTAKCISIKNDATYSLDPTAGANVLTYHDRVAIEIDRRGVLMVDVGLGGSTVGQATLVSRINAALEADLRYGTAYGTSAPLPSAYQITGVSSSVPALRSQLPAALGETSSVKILGCPCDAGLAIFGQPLQQTRLATAASGTTLDCADSSELPTDQPFQVRVRGLRRSITTGTMTSNGSAPRKTVRLLASGYTFAADDVGGYVRWTDTDAHAGNNGLHRIVYTGPDLLPGACVIEHELANTSTGEFTLAGGGFDSDGNLAIYHPGVTYNVTANDTGTGNLTTVETVYAWPAGAIVEALECSPFEARGSVGLGELDVTLDPTYRPNHDFGDALTKSGSTMTLACTRADFTDTAGLTLTLSGCSNLENNGTFSPISFVDSTHIEFTNANGIVETSASIEWSIDDKSGSNNVDVVGSAMPDGWRVLSADTTVFDNNTHTTSISTSPGLITPSPLFLESANNIQFSRVMDSLLDFKGLPLDVAFWMQEFTANSTEYLIEVSFDGSTFFEVASTDSTIAWPYTNTDSSTQFVHSQKPFQLAGRFFVPYDAETVIIRMTRTPDVAASGIMSLERVTITSPTGSGLFLGTNSVARSARRSTFGSLLYSWSSEDLTDSEKEYVGFATEDSTDAVIVGASGRPISIPAKFGHVDYVSNANGYIDRLDVSEGTSGDRDNLLGAYLSDQWLLVETNDQLENMGAVIGTPSRLTYVVPTTTSRVFSEELTMVDGGDGPGTARATLADISNHDGVQPAASFPQPPNTDNGTGARLYEVKSSTYTLTTADGLLTIVPAGTPIPVPDEEDSDSVQPWEFTDSDEIRINAPYYIPTSTYLLDYDIPIRATSEVIDLGTDRTDYLWLADLSEYRRHGVEVELHTRTEELAWRVNFTARLSWRADTTATSTCSLIRDNGSDQTTVPRSRWSFVDAKTLKIDSSVFDSGSVYSFTYTAKTPSISTGVELSLQWRQSDDATALLSEPWVSVEDGQVLTPWHDTGDAVGTNNVLQYHQVRVNATGVSDVRDYRLYGVGLKGLHLFGTASAPGVVL